MLYMGYLQQPTVLELTVGPLPSPSNYTILREVPWNTRPPNSVEYATWVSSAMSLSANSLLLLGLGVYGIMSGHFADH